MPNLDRIEINPKVMMGKPVVKGTRIPVDLILRKLEEGASEDDLLDAYPPAHIRRYTRLFGAIQWEVKFALASSNSMQIVLNL